MACGLKLTIFSYLILFFSILLLKTWTYAHPPEYGSNTWDANKNEKLYMERATDEKRHLHDSNSQSIYNFSPNDFINMERKGNKIVLRYNKNSGKRSFQRGSNKREYNAKQEEHLKYLTRISAIDTSQNESNINRGNFFSSLKHLNLWEPTSQPVKMQRKYLTQDYKINNLLDENKSNDYSGKNKRVYTDDQTYENPHVRHPQLNNFDSTQEQSEESLEPKFAGNSGNGNGLRDSGPNAYFVEGDFLKDFINAHNEYRRDHGAGPLKLNKKISKYSQEWADSLARRNILEHRTDTDYGENIFSLTSTDPNLKVRGEEPVKHWYLEKDQYDFKGNFIPGTGHFTQVIWKDSEEVGVGLAKGKNRLYVVANYDPPGNVIGTFNSNVLRSSDDGNQVPRGSGAPKRFRNYNNVQYRNFGNIQGGFPKSRPAGQYWRNSYIPGGQRTFRNVGFKTGYSF